MALSRTEQEPVRLEKELAKWQSLLPCCVDEETGQVDKDKEAYYWRQIRETRSHLDNMRRSPVPAAGPTPGDFARVKKFLEGLPRNWSRYHHASRNRLLRLVIERVELRGTTDIEATIIWKTGFKETVWVRRSRPEHSVGGSWTNREEQALRELFPLAPPSILRAALPGRSWKSITARACRLGLKRTCPRQPAAGRRAWTSAEDATLKASYEAGVPASEVAAELHRSVYSIHARACVRKLTRPGGVELDSSGAINSSTSLQTSSSGKGKG